eukprot:g5462.t2
MFGKLSLIFLVCLTVSVIGQEFHCSRTNITNDLLTECTNAVRYNSDILQATCHKNTKSYPPYKRNAKLQAAAQAHAEDMARNRFFSHSSYDGTSWYTRIESFGYKGESGENIARNYNTAFASLSTWYCSSGHRKSLLACKFDEIGSGLKCTKDRGCYAVQVFGCSTGKNCCETTEPTKPISSTVPPPSVVPSPSVPIGDSPPPSPDTPEPPRSPPTDSMEPSPSVDPPPPKGTSCSKTISNWKLLTQCLNEIRLDSGVYFSCRGSSEKLRALKSNPKLQAAAQAHAEDMSKKDYFSHSSRDGSSPSDRAKALGYSGSVGENIAWNYNTVYKAMHEWLCSSGHRANILSCKYDEIGSGVYCGGNGCYSVQKFGCSTGWDCCETAKIDPPPASTVPSPSRSPSPSVPIGDSPPPSPDTPEPPKSPPAVSIEPSPSVDPPSPPEETSCSKTISNWKLLTQCLNEIRLDSGVYFSCRGSSEKLRALKSNPKLQAAAQAHAEDMSKKDYFSHSSRDGSSPSDRAKALGYSGSVGENIAWNYNNVYKAFDRWLCSSGHRANILSCKYDEIGSGVYCGGNGCYSVQKFGCSTGWDCCETAKIEPPPASTVQLPSSSPSPSLPIEDSPSSSPDTPMPPRSPPTDSMEPSPSADPVEPPSSPDDSVPPKSPPAFSIEPSPSVDPPSPPEKTSCSKTISNWKLLTQCLNEIRLDSGVYFSCRGSSEKLRALKSNPKLQAAAQAHAEDMSKKDYFSHSSRDGSSPSDRAKLSDSGVFQREDFDKYDLLSYCRNHNLITGKELLDSTPIRYSVVKTYLFQIIQDQNDLNQLQDYVRVQSLLFIQSTRIQNLVAHNSLGEVLSAPDWIGVMNKTRWANVINNHATLMQANIQNMIKVKLLPLAKLYISKLQWNVSQAMLEKLLVKPWPEAEDILQEFHQDTIEIIYSIRQACKIDDDEYFNLVEELTPEGFNLYIHFARFGIQNREILPLATFNRKYSYLDNQIVKQLFGKPRISKKPKLQTESSSSDVANVFNIVFNLSRDAFNQRRKDTRNLRRSKKQKGKRHGFKGLPIWTNIKSLKTDGIGVSLTLSKPITIPRIPGRIFVSDKPLLKPKEWKEQRCEQMRNEDTIRPIFVGVDTGRAKLYTASIEQVDDIESKTCTFTRGLYYWEMGHHKRKAFEKQYRENRPQLIEAYNALSVVGKLYSLPDRLQVEAQYKAVLIEESIRPVDRAIWSMRGHRWKRSSLDRAANRLIDAAKPFRDSQRVVIGIGSGVFPSGGRGEKSVPLKGMEQAIYRARNGVGVSLGIGDLSGDLGGVETAGEGGGSTEGDGSIEMAGGDLGGTGTTGEDGGSTGSAEGDGLIETVGGDLGGVETAGENGGSTGSAEGEGSTESVGGDLGGSEVSGEGGGESPIGTDGLGELEGDGTVDAGGGSILAVSQQSYPVEHPNF